MKKRLVVLLVLGVFFSCCVGCSNNAVTVSDIQQVVGTEEVLSNLEDAAGVKQSSEPISVESKNENITQETNKNKDVSSKNPNKNKDNVTKITESVKAGSSEPSQSTTANKQTADLTYTYPEFNSEKALQEWLKGESKDFADSRKDTIEKLAVGNTITYYRPTELFSSEEHFLKTMWQEDESLHYKFNEKEHEVWPEFIEIVCWNKYRQKTKDSIDKVKADSITNGTRNQIKEYTGIEYACFLNDFDRTVINWEQFGVHFTAYVAAGRYDQLDQILPLLKLEQVTVKLNNDQVTQ